MAVKCQRNCKYFSTYTNTCDYTLMMYQSRGCPTYECTKYEKRTVPRPWSRILPDFQDELYAPSFISGKSPFVPEPPVSPPEELYATAGCGHEVYEGEEIYQWENGITLCPECMSDKFSELDLNERADLLGCEHHAVVFPKSGGF